MEPCRIVPEITESGTIKSISLRTRFAASPKLDAFHLAADDFALGWHVG